MWLAISLLLLDCIGGGCDGGGGTEDELDRKLSELKFRVDKSDNDASVSLRRLNGLAWLLRSYLLCSCELLTQRLLILLK